MHPGTAFIHVCVDDDISNQRLQIMTKTLELWIPPGKEIRRWILFDYLDSAESVHNLI